MMRISIDGDKELERKIAVWASQAPQAVARALARIVLDLRGKAQRLAPVTKGFLRRSAFSDSNATSGTVGFTEVYATRQHEETTWNHPKGGQAKYLEEPYKQNVDKYIKAIGDAVAKEMK
jgi:hypothetical protein